MLRLKVVAATEADALARVLQVLKSHNVTPWRVLAQHVAIRGSSSMKVLEIEIEVVTSDVTPEALRVIAARINQMPIVLAVVVGE